MWCYKLATCCSGFLPFNAVPFRCEAPILKYLYLVELLQSTQPLISKATVPFTKLQCCVQNGVTGCAYIQNISINLHNFITKLQFCHSPVAAVPMRNLESHVMMQNIIFYIYKLLKSKSGEISLPVFLIFVEWANPEDWSQVKVTPFYIRLWWC